MNLTLCMGRDRRERHEEDPRAFDKLRRNKYTTPLPVYPAATLCRYGTDPQSVVDLRRRRSCLLAPKVRRGITYEEETDGEKSGGIGRATVMARWIFLPIVGRERGQFKEHRGDKGKSVFTWALGRQGQQGYPTVEPLASKGQRRQQGSDLPSLSHF